MSEDWLFLAHASEDKPRVLDLYDQLKARGYTPWLDENDLVPGTIWNVEIPKVIYQARAFIACISLKSVKRRSFLQKEMRYALSAFAQLPPDSLYLIPVRLDECEVPDFQIPDLGIALRDHQWVDLFAENGLDKLVAAIGKP